MKGEWYVDALEVLSPLRFHIDELITEIESYNRYASRMGHPLISRAKLAKAKEAQAISEKFFTGKG